MEEPGLWDVKDQDGNVLDQGESLAGPVGFN